MIYEKFRSELSDEQSNFIENYMEIVDHAHFQEEQRAYYQGVNCRFVFHTKRKISTATHYLALAVVILIMNNFILETFVQILHFSVYPAKLMIDKYGDEVLRDTSRDISRYAVCRYYIDGKKTQRYNKKEFTLFSLLKWRERMKYKRMRKK